MEKIKRFFGEYRVLLRSVPSTVVCLFVLSVFTMNLLANKSVDLGVDWLALDCGIIVSWAAFLCMDILTKHYGPKAATMISMFSVGVNLLACLVMFVASLIAGTWGAYYDFGELPVINDALDGTVGGTWYVVLGSTVAFVASAVINNFANWGIGKVFRKKPDGFGAYVCRAYVSTAIAQFADNLIFALIVSHFFFGWTIVQCLTCAATGMIAELLCEAIFGPTGYAVCRRWKRDNVGKDYFEYVGSATNKNTAEARQ